MQIILIHIVFLTSVMRLMDTMLEEARGGGHEETGEKYGWWN